MEHENQKFSLSFSNLKDIPFDKYEKNFKFIVNSKEYETSRFVADLISPIVREYHFTDETMNSLTIETTQSASEKVDYFKNFLSLVDFKPKTINETERQHYIEYFIKLGNFEESIELQSDILKEESDVNKVVDRLNSMMNILNQKKQRNEMEESEENEQNFYKINVNKMISNLSSRFSEIKQEKLQELPVEIIEEILNDEKLKIEDEDGLLKMIISMYEEDDKYRELFEHVKYENVSSETLHKFIEVFNINHINNGIWNSICQRLVLDQDKINNKQYTHTMMVGGYDGYNQLGEKPNKNFLGTPYIHPSQKSSIDPSSLLSFSTYFDHSVQVTRSGKLLGIGDNSDGRISDSLPKTEITEFTEFSIRDVNGHQLDPISAVCSFYGTLYMFSSGSRRQLVLCDSEINGGHPVFLDIGDEYPVSLFGGCYHSAAISNKGEVIFINRSSVENSPESKIKTVCLPDGEKAVSVACCNDSVVALSSNGRVFLSAVESGSSVLNFSTVSELSGQEIVWVSGTNEHFLAVSREGRVFGRGSNSYGQLGLGQQTSSISSFTEISSLKGHKIRAAYAGYSHSLFETREGKILACGWNCLGSLLLSSDTNENVYSPKETTITESATFCIAGGSLSTVFIGGDPPPNTPNRLIEKFE